jgi:hypothetical protein
VNVLRLAGRRTASSRRSIRTIAKVLGDIRSATGKTGTWPHRTEQPAALHVQRAGGVGAALSDGAHDYNLSNNHRLSGSYNWQKFTDFPDTLNNRDNFFPDFPIAAGQASKRIAFSGTCGPRCRATWLNEARVGASGAPVEFFPEMNLNMYTGNIANTNGFHMIFRTSASS